MKQKKLKVFHGLVNYGTQAGLFAQELRNQGIEAISVSYPDKFKRQIDIELLHGGNLVQKIFKHTWNWIRRFYWFFKYNTFHFYYGTSLFPRQLDLPLYKYFGKKVIMEYLGGDVEIYETKQTHYGNDSKTINEKVKKRLSFETKYLNKQLVCAPNYARFVKKSEVLPLCINLNNYDFKEYFQMEEIIILHAPTNERFKGTKYIKDAIDKLKEEGYNIVFDLATNLDHKNLINRYRACNIFIDQIIAGWYGTAAIEACAMGKPTIAYIDNKYFKNIDYGDRIPIINADKSNIFNVLKRMIDNSAKLYIVAKNSRIFVEEVHDVKKLTKKLIDLYRDL